MLIELANSFNLLPVEANKISGTNLLWRDSSASSRNGMSDDQFVGSYSWVIKNNFFSDETRIQLHSTATLFAERYGGFGLGSNGGGARVLNYDKAQIKGVGANALAGDGSPKSHSYGGLDIQGAVKEIIYSRLLNKISPIGAQPIEGLILLDKVSALHNGNPAPSVLMVREPVARPGHLLPCADFRLKTEHKGHVRSDYSRVLGIYKSIGRQALVSEFYSLIQDFLDRCADQLSFFRVARFSHCALAPSNICLDGRVLDTALCSFVLSGTNYGQVTSYFDEVATPAHVAKEWFYLIHKYLGEKPAEDHFLKLYEEKFYQYASVNIGFIFGLDREMSTKLSSTIEWRKVASRLFSLLSMGSPNKTNVLPTVDATDFINDILTASFYSILHNCETQNTSKFLSEFTHDLQALMASMAPALSWQGNDEQSFYKVIAVQTIKRAILSSYFFITYIGRTVDDNYASRQVDNTANLINENDRIIDWVYENSASDRCTIFSGNGVSMHYIKQTDEYIYLGKDGAEKRIANLPSMIAIIDSNRNDYIIQKYDFYPFIKQLFALLTGNAMHSFNGVKNVFS